MNLPKKMIAKRKDSEEKKSSKHIKSDLKAEKPILAKVSLAQGRKEANKMKLDEEIGSLASKLEKMTVNGKSTKVKK